jgi:transglutaminase-like putative cysteine protease
MMMFRAWPHELDEGRHADALAGASKALEIAIAAGLGWRDASAGERLFDPIEVDHFLDWSAVTGSDSFWLDQKNSANRRIDAEDRHDTRIGAAEDGAAPSARFRVSLSRTFDLARFGRGATVRLRLPTPLGCEYHRDVTVTPLIPPALNAETVSREGRLEVRLAVPANPVVTIGAFLDFVGLLPAGDAAAGVLAPSEAELYLRPSQDAIQVTPRMRDLANRLAGSKPPVEAVAAFCSYMADAFRFRFLRYDEIAGPRGDWVVDNGIHDCNLCATLLVTLCRARGIPARLVGGYYVHRLCPTNHNWAEIWIDGRGWLPLDILSLGTIGGGPAGDVGGDQDWPDQFAAGRNYRMVTERLPLAFTGPMSVRFPPAWQMLQTWANGGVAITYLDIADGSLIHRDEVAVIA